ncbi:hypothetical protein QTP88_029887, partial [Uroleucon formosanum]
MLDPRYKSRFIDSQQDVVNHIKLEMDNIGHQECKKIEVVKKEGLAAFLSKEVSTVNGSQPLDLNSLEFNKYLNMDPISLDSDPLKWWKVYENEFPTLAML